MASSSSIPSPSEVVARLSCEELVPASVDESRRAGSIAIDRAASDGRKAIVKTAFESRRLLLRMNDDGILLLGGHRKDLLYI
jgi:hypothetical protein